MNGGYGTKYCGAYMEHWVVLSGHLYALLHVSCVSRLMFSLFVALVFLSQFLNVMMPLCLFFSVPHLLFTSFSKHPACRSTSLLAYGQFTPHRQTPTNKMIIGFRVL